MKALILLGFVILSGCASGRVLTNVTSYGAADLPREVVFIADKKSSIHEIELMKRCAQGVASVGVSVLSQDCPDCLKVRLKTESTSSQVQPAGGFTTGFTYGAPGFVVTNSTPVGAVTVVTKKALVTVVRNDKEVYGMNLVSKSRDDSLLSSIGAMCAAGFKKFPEALEDEPVVTYKVR